MGFYRYVDYAIKCLIRKIIFSKWFWRILFLIIMFFITSFLCNKIVYGAEIPSGYQRITSTLSRSLAIGPELIFLENPYSANEICFYFPVSKGMKYGFDFDFSGNVENFVYGYCYEEPAPGRSAFSLSYYNNLTVGLISKAEEAPIDGYAFFIMTNSNYVTDYVFWLRETLGETIQNSTSSIINNQNQNADKIVESQEKIENTFTSTDYNENVVNIDTSVTEHIDDSSSTGLFTAVFDNLSNLISSSNWSTVETIDIGLPYTDATIQLRSDLLSKIVGNTLLATLINVAWYSLFGLYVFRFSTQIFHAIKSGDILNGLNLENEVISSTML